MINLKGTGVALVTPMKSNGEIDFDSLEKLTNHVCKSVDYIVALGTTGESATLSLSEKKEIIKTINSVSKKEKPLVLGFGGNNSESLIQQMDDWDWTVIDSILSVSPYYNKPSQEGIFKHYEMLAEKSPKPIILYNVPGRTGSNISAETTLRLSQHKNIIGIKEASGDVEQCMTISAGKPLNFSLISGDDMLTPALISIGAEGVISVLANAWPEEFSRMVKNCLSADYQGAKDIWKNWLNLNPLLYEEGNPVGIKAVLEQLKICSAQVRMPLQKASKSLEGKLEKSLLNFL